MKKSERIKPVQGVAEREEKKATDVFINAQNNLRQAQGKLRELCDYRADYQQHAAPGAGMLNLRQLQDSRAFLAKLNDVIEIQRSIVAQCESQLEIARSQWLKKRQKAYSLDRLAGEYRHQEQHATQQREQQHSDELNVLRHSWQLRQRHEECC